MGLYALFASKKVSEKGMVLAIEPSRREFERLKANMKLNHLTNVQLLQVGIFNCRTEAELLIAKERKSGQNTMGKAFGYNSVKLQCREHVYTERLDDIVAREGLAQVDMIKMDIEGAELFALQGAITTLRQFHPVILLELSDRTLKHQGCSSGQVWEFLIEHGYRLQTFNGNTSQYVPAKRQSYIDSENIIAVHIESTIDDFLT
jgi:FkbM family methyltransferase